MTDYDLTGPNGEAFTLTAPDDATPEQVNAVAAQQIQRMQTQQVNEKMQTSFGLPDPTKSFIGGVAGGMAEFGRGVIGAAGHVGESAGLISPGATNRWMGNAEQNAQVFPQDQPVAHEIGKTAPMALAPQFGPAETVAGAAIKGATTGAAYGGVQGAANAGLDRNANAMSIALGFTEGATAGAVGGAAAGGTMGTAAKVSGARQLSKGIGEMEDFSSGWKNSNPQMGTTIQQNAKVLSDERGMLQKQVDAWTDPKTGAKKPFVNQRAYDAANQRIQDIDQEYAPFKSRELSPAVRQSGVFGAGPTPEQVNAGLIRTLTGQDQTGALRVWNALDPASQDTARTAILSTNLEKATKGTAIDPATFLASIQNSPAAKVFFSGYDWQTQIKGLVDLIKDRNMQLAKTTVAKPDWWLTHAISAVAGGEGFAMGGVTRAAEGIGGVYGLAETFRLVVDRLMAKSVGRNFIAAAAHYGPNSPAAIRILDDIARRSAGPAAAEAFTEGGP